MICPPHRPASYISTIVFGDGNSGWHQQFSEECRASEDTHYHQPRFIYYGGWACDWCNAFIRPMTTDELREEVEL